MPATGSETFVLVVVGLALVGIGLAMRRGVRVSGAQAEFGPQGYLAALKRISTWEDT